MKITVATINQAHMISAAGAFAKSGTLTKILSSVPYSRLKKEGLAVDCTSSFLWPSILDRTLAKTLRSKRARLNSEHFHKYLMDAWIIKNQPESEVFLSISSLATRSGPKAQAKGALWVVDRPCSHIETQDALIRSEFEKNGEVWPGISRQIIERELDEYRRADAILLASEFSRRSFIDRGANPEKLWVVPYGVDLGRFKPGGAISHERFKVLFVGQKVLRKGIPTLLEAFRALALKDSCLSLVGAPSGETRDMIQRATITGNVKDVNSVGQAELARLMSEASVLVLPSIEDGYGMVAAQAMACGCPCVVSDHAGAVDLITDGVNGFTFEAGNVESLVSALYKVADHSEPDRLREGALRTAAQLGGWDTYARTILNKCQEALIAR